MEWFYLSHDTPDMCSHFLGLALATQTNTHVSASKPFWKSCIDNGWWTFTQKQRTVLTSLLIINDQWKCDQLPTKGRLDIPR